MTDESPAAALRYQGLRFQITINYFVRFLPLEEWEDALFDEKPPCTRHTRLCDVMSCSGKKGADLLDVVAKQWQRLGCYKEDCVGGTGDAGGENEGAEGLHALLEEAKPDYVRRRCLAHLPWRCADQVLNAIGDHHENKGNIVLPARRRYLEQIEGDCCTTSCRRRAGNVQRWIPTVLRHVS